MTDRTCSATCTPGVRLICRRTSVGSISTKCTTTNKTGGDYYAVCTDTLNTPQGTIVGVGYLNESAIERFEPQTIPVASPPGGSLTILQVVDPNVFKLTLT